MHQKKHNCNRKKIVLRNEYGRKIQTGLRPVCCVHSINNPNFPSTSTN